MLICEWRTLFPLCCSCRTEATEMPPPHIALFLFFPPPSTEFAVFKGLCVLKKRHCTKRVCLLCCCCSSTHRVCRYTASHTCTHAHFALSSLFSFASFGFCTERRRCLSWLMKVMPCGATNTHTPPLTHLCVVWFVRLCLYASVCMCVFSAAQLFRH